MQPGGVLRGLGASACLAWRQFEPGSQAERSAAPSQIEFLRQKGKHNLLPPSGARPRPGLLAFAVSLPPRRQCPHLAAARSGAAAWQFPSHAIATLTPASCSPAALLRPPRGLLPALFTPETVPPHSTFSAPCAPLPPQGRPRISLLGSSTANASTSSASTALCAPLRPHSILPQIPQQAGTPSFPDTRATHPPYPPSLPRRWSLRAGSLAPKLPESGPGTHSPGLAMFSQRCRHGEPLRKSHPPRCVCIAACALSASPMRTPARRHRSIDCLLSRIKEPFERSILT